MSCSLASRQASTMGRRRGISNCPCRGFPDCLGLIEKKLPGLLRWSCGGNSDDAHGRDRTFLADAASLGAAADWGAGPLIRPACQCGSCHRIRRIVPQCQGASARLQARAEAGPAPDSVKKRPNLRMQDICFVETKPPDSGMLPALNLHGRAAGLLGIS